MKAACGWRCSPRWGRCSSSRWRCRAPSETTPCCSASPTSSSVSSILSYPPSPVVIGMGRGWRIAPEHFAERYGLIILIALGESIVAIGVGAGFELGTGVIVAAALGIVVVSALWWLYFDVAAIFARRRLMQAHGIEQARLARDAYNYLHLPMVAGIVLFALGLKTTLGHVDEALDTVPAVGLCGGAALYLLAHSPSSSGPRAESSGGGRSGRSSCSRSSLLQSRSQRSRRSPW